MYFSAVIYHGGDYITSACTFSTMHNNIHFCFTLLVTLAFHSYCSRIFHPCKMVPRFQSPSGKIVGKFFFLSGNFLPKTQNLWLKTPQFWRTFGAKLKFRASVISSVENLQLSVGKLQVGPPPTFLPTTPLEPLQHYI